MEFVDKELGPIFDDYIRRISTDPKDYIALYYEEEEVYKLSHLAVVIHQEGFSYDDIRIEAEGSIERLIRRGTYWQEMPMGIFLEMYQKMERDCYDLATYLCIPAVDRLRKATELGQERSMIDCATVLASFVLQEYFAKLPVEELPC